MIRVGLQGLLLEIRSYMAVGHDMHKSIQVLAIVHRDDDVSRILYSHVFRSVMTASNISFCVAGTDFGGVYQYGTVDTPCNMQLLLVINRSAS